MVKVKVFPNAEFDADFPNDAIEEDGDITVFAGQNVAKAIAEIMRRAGFEPDAPWNEENGWGFHTNFKKRPIWIGVSSFEDEHFHMFVEDASFMDRFMGYAKKAHREFLVVLSRELQADPRFRNITWFADRDRDHEFGSPVPVEGL